MVGHYCRVEPLRVEVHGEALYDAVCDDVDGRSWTYLPYGPFRDRSTYLDWARGAAHGDDPLFHAIVTLADEQPAGVASFLRIDPPAGSIEVGHIHYSPRLAGTRAATEAMYLMMRRVFETGYRRYEWKCDALNAASRRAAQRLGFSYEGVFRQATMYKNRNRDTAWYAIIDGEWAAVDRAFRRWLDPANFGPDDIQRESLSALTAPLLARRG